MRVACVYMAVAVFMAIGVLDIAAGHPRPGVASICLAVANGLLLL